MKKLCSSVFNFCCRFAYIGFGEGGKVFLLDGGGVDGDAEWVFLTKFSCSPRQREMPFVVDRTLSLFYGR